MNEPLIHSHITDCLDDSHPLAWETVMCDNHCGTMVHALNNECMATWVETGKGNFCLQCFWDVAVDKEANPWLILRDEWALPAESEFERARRGRLLEEP